MSLLLLLCVIAVAVQQVEQGGSNAMAGQRSSASPHDSAGLPGIVVSGDWLQGNLGAPSLVILHVGSEGDYEEGHVPGALLLKLSEVTITGATGLRLELPAAEALAKTLQGLGISNRTQVIVYHGTASVQSATRVWFTLDYLGLSEKAALLDGGLAHWKREGRPVSTNVEVPEKAADLMVTPHPEVVAQLPMLRVTTAPTDYRLLDARTPEYYSGASAGMASRAGHIPGAVSVPYPEFFDDQGRWKSPRELRQLLQSDAEAPSPLVTYCHIGQQATVPYVAARMLGLAVRLFDGSYEEWSRDTSLPIETGQ